MIFNINSTRGHTGSLLVFTMICDEVLCTHYRLLGQIGSIISLIRWGWYQWQWLHKAYGNVRTVPNVWNIVYNVDLWWNYVRVFFSQFFREEYRLGVILCCVNPTFELPINLFLILITISLEKLPFLNYCNFGFTWSTVHLDFAHFQTPAWSRQFEPHISTSRSVPAHDLLLLPETEVQVIRRAQLRGFCRSLIRRGHHF